jgi:hypothetical protein
MIRNWAKCLFAVEMFYFLAVCLSKLAILGIYCRIFTSRTLLNITYSLIAVVVAAWIGSTLADILQCIPVECQWDKSNVGSCNCFDILSYFRFVSLPNIITDLVILVLPWRMVWHLKLSRSQKLSLTGVFLIGSMYVSFSVCYRANGPQAV